MLSLSAEDASDLAKALLDEDVSSRAIMLALNKRGIRITGNPIRDFRRDPARRKFIEGFL